MSGLLVGLRWDETVWMFSPGSEMCSATCTMSSQLASSSSSSSSWFFFFQRSLSLKSLSETSSELSEDKVSSGVWRAYFLGRLLFCSVVKALTERALSPTGGRWQLFEQRIPTERCKPRPSPSVPHRLLPALIQSAPLCGKTQNSVRVWEAISATVDTKE